MLYIHMGQTNQTISNTSTLVSDAALNVTQNCLAFMDETQVISIVGSGNVFSGNVQQADLSVDMKCVSTFAQEGDFENKLADNIQQELEQTSIAMTQWMDPSGDNQSTSITQNVTNNIRFQDVQSCLAKESGVQLFVAEGDNNTIVNNAQRQTMNLASQCLMSGGQAATVANEVTNTMNQHAVITSKNPLDFISDALTAIFGSIAAMAALGFVALIAVVLLFVWLSKKRHGSAGSAQMAAATGSAFSSVFSSALASALPAALPAAHVATAV